MNKRFSYFVLEIINVVVLNEFLINGFYRLNYNRQNFDLNHVVGKQI